MNWVFLTKNDSRTSKSRGEKTRLKNLESKIPTQKSWLKNPDSGGGSGGRGQRFSPLSTIFNIFTGECQSIFLSEIGLKPFFTTNFWRLRGDEIFTTIVFLGRQPNVSTCNVYACLWVCEVWNVLQQTQYVIKANNAKNNGVNLYL